MAEPVILPFDGVWPEIHPEAWIAPGAVVIGRVRIGAGSSVWFGCVLRGDVDEITVGAGSNIQDGTIVHVSRGGHPTRIGDNVTIGHAAIVHACTLEDEAFVGMGARILDDAVIGRGGMLGAAGLLPPGKRIGAGELWMGAPARLARTLDETERAGYAATAPHYVALARRYRLQAGTAGGSPAR